MPDIKTSENCSNGPALEFHNPSNMCRCINRDLRPEFRLTGHGTFGKGRLHRGCHTSNWPHHSNERGKIIRAYIKHRTGTRLIEEIWIWMPMFHPVIQPEGCSGNRRSDLSIIDQLNAGLKTST